jgi:nitrite reductase/ring-hydroxylating ferredoxin subunit
VAVVAAARRHLIGRESDFPVNSVRRVTVSGPVAVWRLEDGSFHATSDLCTHYFWSLSEVGVRTGTTVSSSAVLR